MGGTADIVRGFPAERGAVPDAQAFVGEFAAEAGLDARAAMRLELALEEILVNVCTYAYAPDEAGLMTLHVTSTGDRLVVEVEDTGREFEPPRLAPAAAKAASAEDVPVGGLGVFLAGAMVDELTYRRDGDRNIVRVVVKVAG